MQHNHYTPKKYLLRFADSDGRVWLHDSKSNSRSRQAGVRVIGNEFGLYSDEVETKLNVHAEMPSHAAFDMVIAGVPLSEAERAALAKYIIVMWKRVPTAKERALAQMPAIMDMTHDVLMADIDGLVVDDPSIQQDADNARVWAKAYINTMKTERPPHIWYDSFNLGETSPSEEVLLSMNWVFLRSEKHQFLTSDNPVFVFAEEGINRPQSELTFPISSSIALWATRLPRRQGSYVDASPSVVRQINARTAAHSKRFVFSRRNDSWIKPFTIKGGWLLEHLK